MIRFSLSRLRVRLLLLVLFAVVPAFALILYTAREEQRVATLEELKDALRLVRVVTSDQEQLIGSTRQLLIALAELPAVQKQDGASCSAMLAGLRKAHAIYTNLGAIRPNGDMFCSAVSLGEPENLADHRFFRKALESRGFSIGGYRIDRITRKPTVRFGFPVLDKTGRVVAVVFAELDLAWLNPVVARAQLPPGSELTLVDRDGTILARHPDPERWVGRAMPEAPIVKAMLAHRGEGTLEATGVDGVPRLFAFARLPGIPEGAVIAVVGIPVDVAFADVNRVLTRNLIGLGIVATLAFIAAWVGSDLLILRRVRILTGATMRLRNGDLSARTGLPSGRGELDQLTCAFDEMAESLEQHLTERKRAEEALVARTRQLETIRAISEEITRELDLATLLQLIIRRAVELLGANSGTVRLWDEEAHLFVPVAWYGLGDWAKDQSRRFGEALSGTIAQRRAGLMVNDYPRSPYANPAILKHVPINAVLGEPLIYRDRLLGTLTVDKHGPGSFFTEGGQEVLRLFAAQAAIAIENARLFTTTEQRAAELNTLREIDQAIMARLELPSVLEAVVAGAMRLLGTQHTQIILWDEATQSLRFGAAVGTEAEQVRTQTFQLGQGINGAVALTRQPLILDDYQASPYALPEFPDVVATVTVPVLFESRLLGILHSHTTQPGRRFTADDLRRFQMLAAQAAIAIENAHLYSTTMRQFTELRALYDMGQAIVSTLSLEEQLRILVERLGQAMGARRVLVALQNDENTSRFRLCLAYDASKPDPWLRHLNLSWEQYPEIQETMRTGRPLVIPEVLAEPLLEPVRDELAPLKLRSMVVMPLTLQERAIGAISLGYAGQGRRFTDDEVRLFQSFAAQAAIAIEKAQLYEATRQHAAELEVRVQERTRELAAANQQLQKASRHKSEFLANMSHELRTPLNSIIGFAELLQDQRVGPLTEKQARYMAHIGNGGKHLVQLISDILDLSKVEAGKFVFQPEPLEVTQTLEDILIIARGLANKKGQDVQTDIAPDLPRLNADPVRFKQILFNLLSNAVKFTSQHGRIIVTARHVLGKSDHARAVDLPVQTTDEYLEINVTDTGVGIRAADLARLFGEFVQLETTQSQRHEGSGLGLALTKRLVELHGGRIWAASDGEGRGATFTVLLPFAGPRL